MSNLSNKATLIKTAVVSIWIGTLAITTKVMANEEAEQHLASMLTAQQQQVAIAVEQTNAKQLRNSLNNFNMDVTMDMVAYEVAKQMESAEQTAQLTTAKASR